MADFIDLLRMKGDNPKAFKEILEDEKKLAKHEITSAELDAIKKMDQKHIKVILNHYLRHNPYLRRK